LSDLTNNIHLIYSEIHVGSKVFNK